jgi:hypothetical protein
MEETLRLYLTAVGHALIGDFSARLQSLKVPAKGCDGSSRDALVTIRRTLSSNSRTLLFRKVKAWQDWVWRRSILNQAGSIERRRRRQGLPSSQIRTAAYLTDAPANCGLILGSETCFRPLGVSFPLQAVAITRKNVVKSVFGSASARKCAQNVAGRIVHTTIADLFCAWQSGSLRIVHLGQD